MTIFWLILNIAAKFGFNDDISILLDSTNLMLVSYKDEKILLVDKELPKTKYEYFGTVHIEKDNRWANIKIGMFYFNSLPDGKTMFFSKNKPKIGNRIIIENKNNCNLIKNEYHQCVTKGEEMEIEGDKVFPLEFQDCNGSEDQCFTFEANNDEEYENENEDGSEDGNEEENEEENEEGNEEGNEDGNGNEEENEDGNEDGNEAEKKDLRHREEVKDYDLRYVHDDIDKAHHFLAENDFNSVLIRKHFATPCFYGYNSISMFLNDPLPNLRKLKRKYCIYNEEQENGDYD